MLSCVLGDGNDLSPLKREIAERVFQDPGFCFLNAGVFLVRNRGLPRLTAQKQKGNAYPRRSVACRDGPHLPRLTAGSL